MIGLRVRDIDAEHLKVFEISFGQSKRLLYSSKVTLGHKSVHLARWEHKRCSVALTYTVLVEIFIKHKSSCAIVKLSKVVLDVLRRQVFGRIGTSALFHCEDFVALFGAQTRPAVTAVAVTAGSVAVPAAASVTVAAAVTAVPMTMATATGLG